MTDQEERILSEEVRRANLAKDVFDKPIVKETLEAMRGAIIEKWISSKVGEVDAREFCWNYLQALMKFEETFKEAIQTGQMAENMLARD